MTKRLGDYLYGAGSYILGAARDVITQHENESVQAEYERGISRTVAALYDAKIKDDEIVRLIQKYYEITDQEVRKMLHKEKTVEHPCRELHFYLMEEEGYSYDEAYRFIIEHNVPEMLKSERGAWKMSPKELLKMVKDRV